MCHNEWNCVSISMTQFYEMQQNNVIRNRKYQNSSAMNSSNNFNQKMFDNDRHILALINFFCFALCSSHSMSI